MGTERASLRAAITKNIDQSLTEQKLTRNALSDKAGIPKSTLYRNLDRPERFKVFELGQIAEALGMPLTELIKDAA
jgi:predicted transcriptional regulator